MNTNARRALARSLAHRVLAEALTQASRVLQTSDITIAGGGSKPRDAKAVQEMATELLHEIQITYAMSAEGLLNVARTYGGADLELKID